MCIVNLVHSSRHVHDEPELEIKDIHETLNDTEFRLTRFCSILSISFLKEF